MRRTLLTLAVLLLACASSAQIQPTDLVYEGVFAPPRFSAERYGWGMYGMEYDPTCAGQPDPSPNDGYPGCIAATSHKLYDMVGMFDIVPPTTESGGNYSLVPQAVQVVPFFKCSIRKNGSDIQEELATEGNWKPRDIPGIVRTPSGRWICTCGHDWYNVTEFDHDSHCWFDFNPDAPAATGPHNVGEPGDNEYNAVRTSWYLGTIPQAWADAHLDANGQPFCFSGMQRAGGGKPVYSPGPTIYAHSCEEPPDFQPIEAVELLGYHGQKMTVIPPKVHPEYTPTTQMHEVEWIGDTLIAFGERGGDYWWYGPPDPYDTTLSESHRSMCQFHWGEPDECFLETGPMLPLGTEDYCNRNKGYHAPRDPDGSGASQMVWQLQFYTASDLADVAAGNRLPSEVVPYAVYTAPPERWNQDCANGWGLTHDSSRLYVHEGNKEFPVIHVYRIGESQPPIPFCGDGTCDPDEDVCNCPEDCGPPPGEDCADGIDNDCDGLVDCADEDCIDDPVCIPAPDCDALKASCQQFLDECCGGNE